MPKEKEISEEESEEVEDDDSEEEGLEEELEDAEKQKIVEGIDDMEFSSFIQPTIEESAPVLERLAGSQGEGFSLSGWEALASPVSSEGKIEEDDPFKYSVGGGSEEGGVKYISSEQVAAVPKHIDVGMAGRESLTQHTNREASFAQASDAMAGESMSVERYEPTKRMDTESAGREELSESKKIQYDFKPPKS